MPFIESKDMNMRKLLEPAQTAYKVPLYQRAYAWQEDQWQALINDVKSLDKTQPLFLGSVVVVPESLHHAGVNYLEVVDGQQRLATLLIWFSAIRDSEMEKKNIDFANHINNTFLFSRDFDGTIEKLIPKLTLGERDNKTFLAILNREGNIQNDLISKCYSFFKREANYSTLINTLLDSVFIIQINALDHFNAFRLFETLNDRGLELSAVDLIKNYILMQLTAKKVDPQIIEQTIQNWNDMYQKVGDNEPVKFLRRYTMSRFQGKITETKLYETIKSKIQILNISKIVEFVKDINYNASIYKKIIDRGFSYAEINTALSHLSMVEVSPSYTLLLRLFSLFEDKKIDISRMLEILQMIETFHIRWGICGQATAALDQIYSDLSNKIKDIDSDLYVIEVKDRFTKELKSAADDATFEKNFKTRSFRPSELRTKYILWKLSDPTGETIPDINVIETEHIMPQSLSVEWYKYLVEKTGKAHQDIRLSWGEHLNLIGNLTIIKGEWNARDSNKLFEVKKKDYAKSEFAASSNLNNFNNWSFEKIEERSSTLSKKALSIWAWEF